MALFLPAFAPADESMILLALNPVMRAAIPAGGQTKNEKSPRPSDQLANGSVRSAPGPWDGGGGGHPPPAIAGA